MNERVMRIIGWALVAFGFVWLIHTVWTRDRSYSDIMGRNQSGIPKKHSFTKVDMIVAINGVGDDLHLYADDEWIITPAWLLLAGAICLSGCLRKENFPKLRRIARVVMWVILGLVPVIIALAVWSDRYHGILPVMPWQRSAIRAALRETRRIEIHRSPTTLIITNAADIRAFSEVMTPRWQTLYCLCLGMTRTWLIDSEGRTNTAIITDEYIKFGGPWAEHVVFHRYQAVPPKPLLDLMAQYEHRLDASAQPPLSPSPPVLRGRAQRPPTGGGTLELPH